LLRTTARAERLLAGARGIRRPCAPRRAHGLSRGAQPARSRGHGAVRIDRSAQQRRDDAGPHDLQNLTPEWFTRVEAEVAAITPAQVRALAEVHFDPDRASIIAVGSLYRTFRVLKQLGKVMAYSIREGR
jgi:hypothetical protein